MEICGHCHNVLSKTVDRCTVCGTLRVDPAAADVRRREGGDQPSHAPGWAAPQVPQTGIHPEDFLRELAGDEPTAPTPTNTPPAAAPKSPALPPRAIPATPAPGALAGYLGTNVDRRPGTADTPLAAPGQAPPQPAPAEVQDATTEPARFDQHLSTARHVGPDSVAARTTRLDGTVTFGPTSTHRLLTFGAPLVAGLLLIGGVMGSYRIRTSQAAEVVAAETASAVADNAAPASVASIVRLDLDGCGIIDQTTGFLFANNTILVPRSSVIADHRPSVVAADGTTFSAEIQGWSLVRNLAVIRPDERMSGGLQWGVSSRVHEGDPVSVLSITSPGVAAPVAATIANANTINGVNASFELDVRSAEGSVVLNSAGFVIGVVNSSNRVEVSDDIAAAISRIVLENEQPIAVCPAPTTTTPLDSEGTPTDEAEDTTTDE